jgi:hypothetical protein
MPSFELIHRPNQNPSLAHWDTCNLYGTLVGTAKGQSSADPKGKKSDESTDTDKNKPKEKSSKYELTDLGYIRTVSISNLNNFTSKFFWDNIPMLAIITGKNGVGKTQLFNAVLMGFEKYIDNQHHQGVQLVFNTRHITVVEPTETLPLKYLY